MIESKMLMTGQTDFLDLLFGNNESDLTLDGEINFVMPQGRAFDQQFDQQLEPQLDMSELEEIPSVMPAENTGLFDVDCVETVVLAEDVNVEEVPSTSDTISAQHFTFDQTHIDFTEQTYFSSVGSSTDIADDLISNASYATDVSNMSELTGESVPPTPSSATSTASLESLIPVFVKEGLKHTIRNRRKMEGKGDLKVEFRAPSPEVLTFEEEKMRLERRERNRLAAQKCRGKKRERADVLEAQTEKLQRSQDKMKSEIQKLLDERDHLMDILSVHREVCPKLRAQSSSI